MNSIHSEISVLKQRLGLSGTGDDALLELILQNLSEGVAIADTDFNLLVFNSTAEEILGMGTVAGGPEDWQRAYGLFKPDEKTPIPADGIPMVRALRGETVDEFQMFVRNPERPEGVHIEVSARPLKAADGRVRGGIVVFDDVTHRTRALEALRHSEERWRSLVENAPDFIMNVDLDFKIRYINHSLPPKTREEIAGTSIFDYVNPSERPSVERVFARSAKTGKPADYDTYAVNPDGGRSWYTSRLSPIYKDGRVSGFTIISTDDTERRKNREELAQAYARMETHVAERTLELQVANRQLKESRDELRSLYERIVTVQEAERTRIAREIHDVFGQILTSLKFDIAWLNARGAGTQEMHEKLGKMDEIIDSTIKTVRKISSDLRPGALDDLGLTAAIEWQVKDFQDRTGIQCDFVNGIGDAALEKQDASVTLFRALQEALTNVMRHAKASSVKVVLEEIDENRVLEVWDDGIGITEDQIVSRQSLGLKGIRERVAHVGGLVQIERWEPTGTMVRVQVPL
ncbi:MAG: PAS domain S-box protein [Bdellovibrionota bacterium]